MCKKNVIFDTGNVKHLSTVGGGTPPPAQSLRSLVLAPLLKILATPVDKNPDSI